MANKNEFKKQDESLENVEEALSSTSQWIEDHKNLLLGVVGSVVVVVIGIIAISNYVIKPNRIEASNETAKAVVYFSQGEWAKALEGDDADCMGFAAIADEYSMYQEGELAALYAGICHYQLGQYEASTEYMKKFSSDDLVMDPASSIMLGDAYVQMDELDKAVSAFMSAAKVENEILAPIALKKAGLVYLEMGDKSSANKVFNKIKKSYPSCAEAQDAEKYIALTAD